MRSPVGYQKMGVITHAPSRYWRTLKERFRHARWGVLQTLSLIQNASFRGTAAEAAKNINFVLVQYFFLFFRHTRYAPGTQRNQVHLRQACSCVTLASVIRQIKTVIKERAASNRLEPSEWDFRGVNSEYLDVILFYERQRENPVLPETQHLLTPKNRRKIWSLDANAFANENLASELFGADQQSYQSFFIVAVCWLCLEFPKPWMALSTKVQNEAARRYKKNRWLYENNFLRVLSTNNLREQEAFEESVRRIFPNSKPNPASPMRFTIELDWARADDRALKPLLLNLLNLRPAGIHPQKISTGKKATLPVHKLKQIAAYRLKTAGLNYREAMREIERRRAEYPMPSCHLDLLPQYASAGAWSDAVAAGEKLVKSH